MYVKLPTPQWPVLKCLHCISGCSNVIIGDHDKTTMLAGCIKSANVSILLHFQDKTFNKIQNSNYIESSRENK